MLSVEGILRRLLGKMCLHNASFVFVVMILRPSVFSEFCAVGCMLRGTKPHFAQCCYNRGMKIYLDINKFGAATAYPLALFGCFAWGADEAAALAAMPDAVAQWRADRLRYGLATDAVDCSQLDVVERTSSDEGVTDATFSSGLFEAEIRPISQAEVDDALVYGDFVRADLLELIKGLDGNTLNFKPFANMPSVREIIYHIGGADHWYTTRLLSAEKFSADWPAVTKLPPAAFLLEARQRAKQNLAGLTDAQRSATFTNEHNASRPTELWTVRKILRRMVAHEREHIAEIRDYFDALAMTC